MMPNKATYKGKVRDRYSDAVHLFYEYRGYEYMVTDEHNGYSEPMWVKHQNEQREIDERIEINSRPKKEWKYEGSAQEAFDISYRLLCGDTE